MVRSPKPKAASRYVPQRIKVRVALSQKFQCKKCSKPLDEHFEMDHIIPVARGGGNNSENLQALCPGCHRGKTVNDNDTTRKFDLKRVFGLNVMRFFEHDDGTSLWYLGVIIGVCRNSLDVIFIDGDRMLVSINETEDRSRFRFIEG